MFVDFNTCFTEPKQFIRLIVLLSCVFITVYQLKTCAEKLSHAPVSTYNKLVLNESILFPAITICRKPSYKKHLFPKYGLSYRTEISYKGAFKNFPFANSTLDEFMEETTYSLEETINMYGYDGLFNNPKLNISHSYYMQLGRCHTFKTDYPASKLTTNGGIFIYFDHNKKKNTGLLDSSGMYNARNDIDGFFIIIHDLLEVTADEPHQKKTFAHNIFLDPGESVFAALEAKVFHMVDHPDERCVSSSSYSQSKCNQKCLHNRLMKEHNCSLPWLVGDVTYPRCNDSDVIDNITYFLNIRRMEYLSSCKCPIACDLHFYFPRIVKRRPYEEGGESIFALYYDTSIITVVQQIVTYNWNSFISDLGGSLGLFLGLSVIGLIDILEAGLSALFKKKREKFDREERTASMNDHITMAKSMDRYLSLNTCSKTEQKPQYEIRKY